MDIPPNNNNTQEGAVHNWDPNWEVQSDWPGKHEELNLLLHMFDETPKTDLPVLGSDVVGSSEWGTDWESNDFYYRRNLPNHVIPPQKEIRKDRKDYFKYKKRFMENGTKLVGCKLCDAKFENDSINEEEVVLGKIISRPYHLLDTHEIWEAHWDDTPEGSTPLETETEKAAREASEFDNWFKAMSAMKKNG